MATKLNFLQYSYRPRINHTTLYSQTFPGSHFGSWTINRWPMFVYPSWLHHVEWLFTSTSIHCQIDCRFNNLVRPTITKTTTTLHYWPFMNGIHRYWWISLKDHYYRESITYSDVIMSWPSMIFTSCRASSYSLFLLGYGCITVIMK